MQIRNYIKAAVILAAFSNPFPAVASGPSYPTSIQMTCTNIGLYPTLDFTVQTTEGVGAPGGTASASYTQTPNGPPEYYACGNGVSNGRASCSFEANHYPGQYFFTAYYSGYTTPEGVTYEPSSVKVTCILPD